MNRHPIAQLAETHVRHIEYLLAVALLAFKEKWPPHQVLELVHTDDHCPPANIALPPALQTATWTIREKSGRIPTTPQENVQVLNALSSVIHSLMLAPIRSSKERWNEERLLAHLQECLGPPSHSAAA